MRVVIVGTGQGGFQVAASLRDAGFSGPVTLIGDEAGLPYQRPPLSKAYLGGKSDEAALELRPAAFFAERDIAIRAGERATAIDRDARTVALASGDAVPYDHLVLATGSRNRPLPVPGTELDGVWQLRGLADAARIKAALESLRRVVVVGAGFIGLEFAAVAAARGIAVTVVEALDRPMSRAVSPAMSAFFRARHESAGVAFTFGAVVGAITGEAGRATGVETLDGRHLPADAVLVGIGVIPNEELASGAGLPVRNGIVVDDQLLTADPAISAIGDVAHHPSRFAVAPLRVESVQNAVDQARAVAARLTGRPTAYASLPWFWSDQGPDKLQIAGLGGPEDEAVLRGDPAADGFSVFRYRAGRLACVESVNRALDHMIARKLLVADAFPSPGEAADPGFDLRGFAKALDAPRA